jgi:hypothetical protein
MNGNVIFDELNEFTDRRGFYRNRGQRFSTIEIIYESHDSKGVTNISSESLLLTLLVPIIPFAMFATHYR